MKIWSIALGLLLVVVVLLMARSGATGDGLPPILVENGGIAELTLVAGAHNMRPEVALKHPNGARWKLRLPRDYVNYASRIRRDEPEWNDLVYLDLHWPSMEPWKRYEDQVEKTPDNRLYKTTYPYVTSARAAYFISVTLRAKPAQFPDELVDARRHRAIQCGPPIGRFAIYTNKSAECEFTRMVGEAEIRPVDNLGFPTDLELPRSELRDRVLMQGAGEFRGWSITVGMPTSKIQDIDTVYSDVANFLTKRTVQVDPMRLTP
jgi:hypothetical protein